MTTPNGSVLPPMEPGSAHTKLFSTLLDVQAYRLGLPVGFFDVIRGTEIMTPTTYSMFSPYCRLIRKSITGEQRCTEDHIRRAANVERPAWTVCHAGLHDYALPLQFGDKHIATIMFGQVRRPGYDADLVIRYHRLATAELPEHEKQVAREAFQNTRTLTDAQASQIVDSEFRDIFAWYCQLVSGINAQSFLQQESKVLSVVERTKHELSQRTMALLARSSNLIDRLHMESQKPKDSQGLDLVTAAAVAGYKEVRKLLSLVNNMTGASGIGPYRFEMIDIASLIRESCETYKAEADFKKVRYRFRRLPSKKICVSRLHMECALDNIVWNAVKYSYKGRSEEALRYIDVSGRETEEGYAFEISNVGPEILPDEYEKVWQPRYRGVLARLEHKTGSGMGLPLVKQVINRHGGICDIWCQPLESESTVSRPFLITLSVALPNLPPEGSE